MPPAPLGTAWGTMRGSHVGGRQGLGGRGVKLRLRAPENRPARILAAVVFEQYRLSLKAPPAQARGITGIGTTRPPSPRWSRN